MKKGQQKLYQQLTAKEIINQLDAFVNYYKEEEKRIPLCMVAAIEYIYLHEEKEKRNAKKTKDHIDTN